jgi:hypothetical protein
VTRIEQLAPRDYAAATLVALQGLGGKATNAQIVERVADDLRLSIEDRSLAYGDGSVTRLHYFLGWARTQLRREGAIRNCGRGEWELASADEESPRDVASLPPVVDAQTSKPGPETSVSDMSIAELLFASRETLRELRRRGVIRTMNAPAGDLAEWLIARHLGGELEKNSAKSWDVTAGGRRVQVKARVVTDPSNAGERQLGVFRSFDFDDLAVVLFDGDLALWNAMILPLASVESLMRRNDYVNGSRLRATDALFADVENLGGSLVGDELGAILRAL